MKNKKVDLIIIALLVISLAGILAIYPQLPEVIPTHWNFKGQMDGQGSKSTLFLLWGMAVGLNALFIVISRIDPKRENYAKFSKVYHIFRVVMTIFMLAMIALTIYSVKKPSLNVNGITTFMIGILFALLGNYLPKCKHNYSFGIKTPWTLASERVWNKTHRMAGPIWVASGLAVSVCAVVFPSHIVLITMLVFLPMVFIPMVYSYMEFSKEKREKDL